MGKFGQIMVCVLVVELLFSALVIITDSSSASPLTTVTISLQGAPPKVDVSPGSSGIVVVAGNVTCQEYGPDQVKVSLTASSEISGASCNPPNLVFEGVSGSEESKPIEVSTRVPVGTTSSATPALTVSGSFVQGGLQYSIPPVSAIIEVLPYCKIEAMVGDVKNAKAGDNIEIVVKIINVGNCDDSFTVDINNREHLGKKGFDIPAAKDISIPEKDNGTENWKLGTNQDMSGEYYIEFIITSKTTEDDKYPVYTITACKINIIEQSLSEQMGSYFLSPIPIVISIIIIISAVVYKKRKTAQ